MLYLGDDVEVVVQAVLPAQPAAVGHVQVHGDGGRLGGDLVDSVLDALRVGRLGRLLSLWWRWFEVVVNVGVEVGVVIVVDLEVAVAVTGGRVVETTTDTQIYANDSAKRAESELQNTLINDHSLNLP